MFCLLTVSVLQFESDLMNDLLQRLILRTRQNHTIQNDKKILKIHLKFQEDVVK
jgi:hypothetical protein